MSLLASIPLLKSAVLNSSSLPARQGQGSGMLCTGEVPEGKQKAQVQTGEQPWSQQQRTDLYILRQPRILPGFFVSRKCWFLSLTHISVLFAKHLPGTWGLGEAGACSRDPQLGTEPFSSTVWGGLFSLPVQPLHTWLHSPGILWESFQRVVIASLSQWPLLGSGNLLLISSVKFCVTALGRIRIEVKPPSPE